MKYLLSFFIVYLFLNANLIAAVKYDYIKVRVNDEIITYNEIESRTLEIASFNKIDETDFLKLEQIRARMTKQLIEQALIDTRARELNIIVTEEQLEQEIGNFIKQRKLNQTQFEEILEKQQMTLEDFKKQYSQQLSRNRLIGMEIRSKIKIDEKKLKEDYEKTLIPIQKARVRHILLKLEPDASPDLAEEVKNKLLGLKKQIENGVAFEKIVELYSEDPAAKTNYGDLGFFEEKDIADKEFAKAVFSLPLGVMSEPIRTALGFHLVEVAEKRSVSGEPFFKVKDKLYQKEFKKAFSRKYDEYIERLRKNATIIKN